MTPLAISVLLATSAGHAGNPELCRAIDRVEEAAASEGLDRSSLRELERRYCSRGRDGKAYETSSSACTDLSLMVMLARIEGAEASMLDVMEARRAFACTLGRADSKEMRWPNGVVAQLWDGSWRYPSGVVAKSNDGTFRYPDGSIARHSDGMLRYPDGRIARDQGGWWRTPDGSPGSLEEILVRLRTNYDDLFQVGELRGELREAATLGIIWQAKRW